MFGLKKAVQQCPIGLLVDIQSASITLSLVTKGKSADELVVIWKLHTPINLQSAEPSSHIQKKMLGTLLESFMQLQVAGLPTIQKYHVGAEITDVQIIFASPWILLHNQFIEHKDTESFTITLGLLENLAHDTMSSLEQIKSNSLPKTTIDYTLSEITANYYPIDLTQLHTDSIVTNHVRFLCITTHVDKAVYDQVSQLAEKLCPKAVILTYPRPIVLKRIVSSLLPQLRNFCICDIDLELTTLTFVNTTGELSNIEIPFGINTLIRELAEELDLPKDHIKSVITDKNLYAEFSAGERQKAILDTLRKKLQETMHETIISYQGVVNIPKTVVYPHNETTDWLMANIVATSIGKITNIDHTTIYLSTQLGLELPHEERQLAQYFFHNRDQIGQRR